MRKLSFGAVALLTFALILSGGPALAQTVLALDADGDPSNGIQDTAVLQAGTHVVSFVVTELAASANSKLAGYTGTIDFSSTAVFDNTVTLTDKTGFGLATATDTNIADSRARLGRAGTAENTITLPYELFTMTLTVTGDLGAGEQITLTIPNPAPTIVELGNLSQFSIPITAVQGCTLTAGGVTPGLLFPYWPGFDIANDLETWNAAETSAEALFLLDGWGAAHKIGGAAVPFFNPAYFPGQDLLVDLELDAANESAFTLDVFGAVHGDPGVFGSQVYFFDATGLAAVAVDFEPYMDAGAVTGGWVLDEFGNVWPVGQAPDSGGDPIFEAGLPGRSTDPLSNAQGAANDLYAVDFQVVNNGAGVVILDSFGLLHFVGTVGQALMDAPALQFGFNIARDLYVNAAGDGAIVLDGYGAVHPLGNIDAGEVAAILADSPYFPNLDIARDFEVYTDSTGSITGAQILDGFGAIHNTGAVTYPAAE